MDVPGPETIGAMGGGPGATVAMSRATWAAVVVRVCGRCGVVGGRDRGVGGPVVFRRRFDVSVADDGWDEANEDRTSNVNDTKTEVQTFRYRS